MCGCGRSRMRLVAACPLLTRAESIDFRIGPDVSGNSNYMTCTRNQMLLVTAPRLDKVVQKLLGYPCHPGLVV